MQNQNATTSLREALASLPRVVDEPAKTALRSRVTAFVDVAKAEGWPVERIVVAVKEIAAEAGLRSSTDILRIHTTLKLRDELLLDLVRWCVEHYFGYTRSQGEQGQRGALS